MKNPERFSPLADALMASLASRSFEWREWSVGELETRSPGQENHVRTWIRVVTSNDTLIVRELESSASASAVLQEFFGSALGNRATPMGTWPTEFDALPEGPDPRATEDGPRHSSRFKNSNGSWGERVS